MSQIAYGVHCRTHRCRVKSGIQERTLEWIAKLPANLVLGKRVRLLDGLVRRDFGLLAHLGKTTPRLTTENRRLRSPALPGRLEWNGDFFAG